MAWRPAQNVGDTAPEISDAKEVLDNYLYGQGLKPEKAANDGKYTDTYTQVFGDALRDYAAAVNAQVAKGQRKPPYISEAGQAGVFDWTFKAQMGMLKPPAPVVMAYRPIYYFSAPGSGANNLVGPSNDVGQRCWDILRINHIRLDFPIGGYLGLLGGDPGLSYIEVIRMLKEDLRRKILWAIADAKARWGDKWIELIELWFSGYSQSADGMVKAVLELFGDGGEFAYLRSRINGLILFGNPARQPGPCRIGSNPAIWLDAPGWGIARDLMPAWLNALTYSITTLVDMYACAEDNTFQPILYDWFVEAELSLSFIEFSAGILIPVVSEYLGLVVPLVGGIFSGFAQQLIATATGLALPFLSTLLNRGVATDPRLNDFRQRFHDEFGPQALLSIGGITKVFKSLAAMPGIDTHGRYWENRPEFGGRTGIDVGYDIVAGYRRPVAA